MLTSSRKSKGRLLQNLVVLKFRELFEGILEKDDIKPAIMGTSGVDTVLSPSAKNLIVFDIECKNVEKLIGATLQNAIDQAESNSSDERIPLLIFKKNNSEEYVLLKFHDFLGLIYPNNNVTFGMDDAQKIVVELEKIKQLVINNAKRTL
jgi:hypothetical protein